MQALETVEVPEELLNPLQGFHFGVPIAYPKGEQLHAVLRSVQGRRPVQNLVHRYAHRSGDVEELQRVNPSVASLDPGDSGLSEAGLVAQLLLSETGLLSHGADRSTELRSGRPAGRAHVEIT